jgi:hypothetical protein
MKLPEFRSGPLITGAALVGAAAAAAAGAASWRNGVPAGVNS